MAAQATELERRREAAMKVREWMSPDPITIGPASTVREARKLLVEQGVRHLPVVDDNRVVGMISDRDVRVDDAVLARLEAVSRLGELLGWDRPVEAVMSAPVHTVGPDEPIEAAARTMLSRRISALPVIDPEFGLVGVITTTDCLLASLTPEPAAW
jgi:acetoin utilization protein AcuB